MLSKLELDGFRSIASEKLDFRPVNILIGPNGAGKSNLIAFFRMLSFMLSTEQGLARYVAQTGGASSLLHNGPKITTAIRAHLMLETVQGTNDYEFELDYAASDSFYFERERCRFSAAGKPTNPRWIDLGVGHTAPKLLDAPQEAARKTQRTILSLLRGVQVYQFHDTSSEARVKQRWLVEDNRYLRGDASNLAAFLLRLHDQYPSYYRRICETLRQIAPFFEDFVLEPEGERVLLRWRETRSDLVFGPHQMSDGTIRAVALLTLLLQPPQLLPSMIVLDEPELGLHPAAVRVVAGLVHAASVSRQCFVATQSPEFLNEFNVEDIIVVERQDGASRLRRLPQEHFERWLDEYSLGELWDMNMLGGRPRSTAATEV
ncbi:AAA family ATPase [Methylobacterium tarhaniae]|uniref:AAA family ATPase n=1 Tax=Methylobacterium tarhaniae TaxID=1187852 RepID=UPI0006544BE8|nr:AAA family ATPase [Methylobacterium tarhaniae]